MKKSINTYYRVPYIGLKKPVSTASSSFLFLLSLLSSSSSILQTYLEVPFFLFLFSFGNLGPHLHLSFLEKFREKKTMVGPCNLSLKSTTIKFLCSYGGKILPRYPDGKLRYHGGETRVLAVDRSISFSG